MPNSSTKAGTGQKAKKKLVKPRSTTKSKSCGGAPHPGQKCPECGQGKLDYDGLLQLCCPACGYLASGGGFT